MIWAPILSEADRVSLSFEEGVACISTRKGTDFDASAEAVEEPEVASLCRPRRRTSQATTTSMSVWSGMSRSWQQTRSWLRRQLCRVGTQERK
jgi:hypothetical protein